LGASEWWNGYSAWSDVTDVLLLAWSMQFTHLHRSVVGVRVDGWADAGPTLLLLLLNGMDVSATLGQLFRNGAPARREKEEGDFDADLMRTLGNRTEQKRREADGSDRLSAIETNDLASSRWKRRDSARRASCKVRVSVVASWSS